MKSTSWVTGIVLAGGRNSRMECEKAFLKLGSRTIVEELILKLEKKFSRLIIIANQPEKYMRFGSEVISDILPEKGPLGGIYTGLLKSDNFYNFVFACDMPLVNPDLIDYMVDRRKGSDIVLPRWQGKFEPLYAIYSKNCAAPIKAQLEKNDLKIINFFSQVKVKVIEQKEVERFDPRGQTFVNINTPRDYKVFVR